jgi:hypothetical protein
MQYLWSTSAVFLEVPQGELRLCWVSKAKNSTPTSSGLMSSIVCFMAWRVKVEPSGYPLHYSWQDGYCKNCTSKDESDNKSHSRVRAIVNECYRNGGSWSCRIADGAYVHYSPHCWLGDSNATISSFATLFRQLEGPPLRESGELFEHPPANSLFEALMRGKI